MSLSANVYNLQGEGWHLIIDVRSNGRGDAKFIWEPQCHMHPEFWAGFSGPAAALETVLMRVEANGGLSPLDIPVLVGVLCGYFEARAR